MFYLTVTESFESAHYLRGYVGKCANMHGHNFKIRVLFEASQLDEIGLGCDFQVLKEALRRVIKPLDHCDLNELPPFRKINPTAENLARHIYQELKQDRGISGVTVKEVAVWETDLCCAAYRES